MSEIIKACIDRYVPEELIDKAAQLAIQENIENKLVGPEADGAPDEIELALATKKKWKTGRTLKIGFLDGHPDVQKKVEQYAMKWCDYANIKFDFGNHAKPEIRISFKQKGSWSYLGTDNLAIADTEATMNFGWLTPDSPDDEYDRTVIHEFGHALGCIHEHQHPEAGIPWDEEKVYEYYMGPPNNWPKAQVHHNLLRRYDKNITQFSLFDTESIMLYPVSNSLTKGDFEIGWNRGLSKTDKEFIAEAYPKVSVST